MKKIFSLLTIMVIIAMSNCSEIPENNDPILGIWSRTEVSTLESNNSNEAREEWIFNDVFLGRYQSYTNNNLEFFTDFSWSIEEEVYTIVYSGTDIPDIEVTLEKSANSEKLALENGSTFAERE